MVMGPYEDQTGRMQTTTGPPRLYDALRMRCPLCSHHPITHSFGEIVEHCPGCGYEFEKGESGYFVGAMIINTAICILAFLLTFGVGLAITWPDVPWTALTYVCLAVMVVLPVWFYPRSKTVWVWLDLAVLNRGS